MRQPLLTFSQQVRELKRILTQQELDLLLTLKLQYTATLEMFGQPPLNRNIIEPDFMDYLSSQLMWYEDQEQYEVCQCIVNIRTKIDEAAYTQNLEGES